MEIVTASLAAKFQVSEVWKLKMQIFLLEQMNVVLCHHCLSFKISVRANYLALIFTITEQSRFSSNNKCVYKYIYLFLVTVFDLVDFPPCLKDNVKRSFPG